MQNNQAQTHPLEPVIQSPEPTASRKSNVLIMVLGGIILLGLGLQVGYFLSGKNQQKTSERQTVLYISPTAV